MDFSFTLPDAGQGSRRAFRATVPGLYATVGSPDRQIPVRDLSATGLALDATGPYLKEGELLELDLLINQKRYLHALKARVVRTMPDKGITALTFEDLDRKQEEYLDKLVLEVQKRLIAIRRAREKNEQGK